MSTVFVLKGINPANHVPKAKDSTLKVRNKYDVVNPGKVSHVNGSGAIVRVLQRGEVCNKFGNPYDKTCSKSCWWHRQTFDGLAMGIPIRLSVKDGVSVLYMDGVFCSYSCVLAYLEDHFEKMPAKRDPNYKNSITLLRQLFLDEFPGEKLTAALDWKLLKDVGNGNLTIKDFITGLNGLRLNQHPNYQYLPVTVSYDIVK